MVVTTKPNFNPSLIIQTTPSRIGYHAAKIIHNPVTSQSPFAAEPSTSGLVDQFGRPISNSILSSAVDKKDAITQRSEEAAKLLRGANDILDTDPLIACQMYDQAKEITSQSDPYTALIKAHDFLGSDEKQAGRMFKKARLALEANEDTTSEIYNMAVLGEARYGEIEDTTFDALARVRKNYGEDEAKLSYEKFVRATAYLRAGNESAADDALVDLTLSDSSADLTTLQAWAAKADLYMSMGLRTTHDARNKYFTWARNIMVEDVPRVLEEIEKSGVDVSGIKKVLAQLYISTAEFFIRKHIKGKESPAMTVNYPLFTQDVLGVLVDKFGDVECVKELLDGSNDQFSYFLEGGKLKPLRLTTGDRLRAAVLEAVYHMKFPKRGDFWKASVGTAFLAILAGIVARGDINFYEGLHDGALGALGGVGGAKIYLGATAPETCQAYETGYSNKTKMGALKMGTGEFLKLVGTYAFFGGAIPGLGALAQYSVPAFLMADYGGVFNHAHIHGPGSALTALTTDGLDTLHLMGKMIAQHGWSGGLEAFWIEYQKTVPGLVIRDSIAFWDRTITNAVTKWPSTIFNFLWNTATNWEDPWNNVLRMYKGAAAGYATAMMIRPGWREKLLRKFPKGLQFFELGVLAGAYMVAADINLATGVKPWDAWRIPALGIFSQMRLQLMGGNRLDNMDWAAYMRAMIIPTLYTGTGAQMTKAAFKESTCLYDDFKISMWVQASLYPIGFIHAMLVGSNIWEQAKIKGWKSWREETVGNLLRLNFKWDSLWGTAFSMGVQIFLQPWINSTWREASGAPMQRQGHQKKITPPDYDKMVEQAMVEEGIPLSAMEGVSDEDGDYVVPALARIRGVDPGMGAKIEARVLDDLENKAKALENAAMQGGARWDYWNWLKGKTWTERTPFILAFYFAYKKKDAPFPTSFQTLYYRKVVFRALIDPRTPKGEVEQYLRLLKIIARDIDQTRFAMRQNLLISTWAARNGPHGELIEEFFEDNSWLKEYYDVKDEKPPENWGYVSAQRWFNKNLRRSNISADGIIDDDTSWWQRIKGRSGARKGEGKEAAKAG